MIESTRIPRGIDSFNPYFTNACSFLVAGEPKNSVRLGLLESETTKWTGFLLIWAPLYSLYSDKKNTRTTAIKDQLIEIIDNVVAFDQSSHILDRIAASPNVTIIDMETFNIKKGALQKSTRSVSTTPISDMVTVSLKPIGGGSFSIKCSNNKKTSIQDESDCVQYVYVVGDTPPASAETMGLMKDLSTKASFILALGAGSSAKYLYIYFRWYNTKHSELAGPWSALQTNLIL